MVIFCSMIFPFTDKIACCMLSYPYVTREMKCLLTDCTDKIARCMLSYPYVTREMKCLLTDCTDKIARCMLSYPYVTRKMNYLLTDCTDKIALYQHFYPYIAKSTPKSTGIFLYIHLYSMFSPLKISAKRYRTYNCIKMLIWASSSTHP